MRGLAAIPIALALCATPALAKSRGYVAAAKKAERRGEWAKALRAWKAAYAREGNAEYLISIGDAWSHLGKTAEARRTYQGYLADPLALPSGIRKVNARLEQMAALPLSLPLPALAPARAAARAAAPPPPPPVRVEAMPPPPVRVEAMPPPPAAPAPGVAAVENPPPPPSTKLAVAAPVAPERRAPMAAVMPAPLETAQPHTGTSRVQRTLAYATAAVAVVALGGGALAYQQANSTHGELTGGIHSPAETQRLLENEQRYRTLSVIGVAGGLALAGVATALFAF